jgi:hypothetical protein
MLFIKCKVQGDPMFTVDVAWTQEEAVDLLKEYREDDPNSKYSLSDTEGQEGLIKTSFNTTRFNKYKGEK